jgi:hypothetical protein
MILSPRLRVARWSVMEAQATLDRSEAIRRGQDVAAINLWIEICVMRRIHWAATPAPSA